MTIPNMTLTVNAPAKINLTLDILGRREDGYHSIRTVMQTISLSDTVGVSLRGDGEITIDCSRRDIPCGKTNIAYKAAEKFFTAYREVRGADIYIQKNIPSQAGLAGGSADGAAVLIALNELCGKPFSADELERIGALVGADVPFCVRCGTVLAEGIGERMTTLRPLGECFAVLVKPPVSISTAQAYAAVDSVRDYSSPSCATDRLLRELDDIKAVGRLLSNDFEYATALPEIASLKERMLSLNGCIGACMTGSGSVVYGLFDDEALAEEACAELRDTYSEVYSAVPVGAR